MSKIEEKALKVYPRRSILIQPARRGGYYADNHLREGYIEGYRQALEDVRKEVERRMTPLKPHGEQGIILTETIKEHYRRMIDFIDEQNK